MTRGDGREFNVSVNSLDRVAREMGALVAFLDRRMAMSAALEMMAREGDVVWVAEPTNDGSQAVVLSQVRGNCTDLLNGLRVRDGLGLTGKVFETATPSWVDDYIRADSITHDFDRQIAAERILGVVAVPVRNGGQKIGVLAVGTRSVRTIGSRSVERARVVADELALAVAVAERARLAREIAVHEERSRLAVELHDNVGGLLFAIGSGVARLAENAGKDPELEARLERLQRQASEASAALRESLRTLRASPAALALAVELRADCAAFTERTGIPAELLILDEDPPALPPAHVRILVGAVREALLNIEKHAGAGAVVVTASRRTGGGVIVAITDDGGGLRPEHAPGIGLTAATGAVERVGGSLRVTSDTHGGTTCRIELRC